MRVASDAGEDLVGGFGPNERLGGFVVGGDEFADGNLQFADTAVNPAADLLVGEFGKPPPDEGRLVGPIVVHDDVDIEVGRRLGFDRVQELAELDGGMAAG